MGNAIFKQNTNNNRNLLANKLSELSLKRRYYNSIKFMVHMTDSKEKRQMMISQIAYANPYLCAQIIMTICEDTCEEEKYLLEKVLGRLRSVTNNYKRVLLLMALAELGNYENFEEGIMNNRDLLDNKTINFFSSNFNTQQLVVLMKALLKAGINKYNGIIIRYLKKGYNGEQDSEIIDLSKALIKNGQITFSYKLLKAVRLNCSEVLKNEKDYIEAELLSRIPFSVSVDFEMYLNFKYGFSKINANDKSLWENIFNSEGEKVYGRALNPFLKSCLRSGYLSDDTILYILKLKGIDDAYIDKSAANNYLSYLLRKNSVFVEPFYSLMQDESEILQLLNNNDFTNEYEFKIDVRLDINTEFDIAKMKESYKYFDQCVANFSSPENLIRVYFNTPLKMSLNVEYLINALETKFKCDEKRLRYLLGDYIFKGKVCNINENSVSIRAYNIWTTKPCRMNTKKYWVMDGDKRHILAIGDILYFKFNYITTDTKKVNVHFPELSLEQMREKEKNRRKTGND